MEKQYTRTPWEVKTDSDYSDTYFVKPSPTFGESYYNAKLIAAAPELLEALQNMVNLWRGASVALPLLDEEIAYHKAQEAINKALGK